MIGPVLREVRLRNGLSVRALAAIAEVSPATIDRLEHERVAPTRSIDQILASIGCRLVVRAERIEEAPLTREDRRSLAFHRAIAQRFLAEPEVVRSKARGNLVVMREANDDGSATGYFDQWEVLLDGPEADLVAVLLRSDEPARALRQVTPFAGVLTPEERSRIYDRRGPRAA
jgi:transcriptional regulator with XRE-family HTH domain